MCRIRGAAPPGAAVTGKLIAVQGHQQISQVLHGVGIGREDEDGPAFISDLPEFPNKNVAFGVGVVESRHPQEAHQSHGFRPRRLRLKREDWPE